MMAFNATSAWAAVLYPQYGRVAVNIGQGFVAVAGPTQVAPGAQVLIQDDGRAIIEYSPACSTIVGAGRVWVVERTAPCAEGVTLLDYTQAGAWETAIVAPATDYSWLLYAGLGGAAIAGLALGLGGGGGGGDHPASP